MNPTDLQHYLFNFNFNQMTAVNHEQLKTTNELFKVLFFRLTIVTDPPFPRQNLS